MTTTPNEPVRDQDTAPSDEDGAEGADDRGESITTSTTSAEDVTGDGPLDADEGDPHLDSYPG